MALANPMLNSLQACRAAAAILVVLYHASCAIYPLQKYFGHKPFGPIFDFGFAGVDFFFVLSGFLMMYVHGGDIGQPSALGVYLWKRFSRIYPVYWVVLAGVIPVYFLASQLGAGYEREPDVIVRSILLYPHPESKMVLTVAWTLVYEVFFYLLFGLLILDRRIGLAVLAAWTAGILAYPWLENELSPFVFNNMNLRFLAGAGVALILRRWELPCPRLLACLGAGVFATTGFLETLGGPLGTWTVCTGFTLGSALMVAGFVEAERSGLLKPPTFLVYLGNASYSIYLVHFPGLSILAKLSKAADLEAHLPHPLLFCLQVLGAIGIGCVFHHLVERPIQAWSKSWMQRRNKSSTAPIAMVPPRQAA